MDVPPTSYNTTPSRYRRPGVGLERSGNDLNPHSSFLSADMGIYSDNYNRFSHSQNDEPSTSLDTAIRGMALPVKSQKRAYITIGILFFINLINYMDRLTIAGNSNHNILVEFSCFMICFKFFSGVLTSVKSYYDLSNTEAGLLQTAFVISYMIMAPIFGYLGDRYNRKKIMIFGVLFWSATTFAGSFVPSQVRNSMVHNNCYFHCFALNGKHISCQ